VALLAIMLALLGPPCETVDLGHGASDLARMFTPLTAPTGTYEVTTTTRAIGELSATLKACDPAPSPGAWEITRPEVHDAFGEAGIYDHARLAQLFGGKRLQVVRGTLTHGAVHDAYTLISPYPDATLTEIHQGTLVIVLHVPSP
jgi:hypothetical protein